MIGKHVVIDTLDNFKAKLDLIPSSAIVLIKDVGQIYAHGTYFGAQKTYSLLTKTADGLAPKGGTSASSLISNVDTEWVLTVTNGANPSWRKLPANAFSSFSYTLPAATTSALGGVKVGTVNTSAFADLSGKYYKLNIDKNGLAYVEVPWTTYTLSAATSTNLGGVKVGNTLTDTTGYTAVPIKDGVIYYKNTTYSTLPNPNSLTLKYGADSTQAWTYNGSSAKSLTIKPGSNISISGDSSGTITIANTYSYTLPTASDSKLGGVKINKTITDTAGYTEVSIKDGVLYYKDNNTTYTTKAITINGTAYNVYTSSSSLPTFYAPTSLGTANQVLKVSSDGKSLVWGTDKDSNSWRPVKLTDGTTDTNVVTDSTTTLKFKAGNNVTLSTSGGVITIASSYTNTWTAWKGATSTANGTAGYMPAPTSAQRNQFLRGDGTWVSLNNYSLPTASSSTLGGVKTGAAITDTTGYTAISVKDGILYYKDSNTTYTFYNLAFLNSDGTAVDTYKPTTSPTKTVKAGSNITISAASNVITIAAKDTTYGVVSSTANGLAPKIPTSNTTAIATRADEWVLTTTKGATPTWRLLPANAFNNTNYYRPISVNGTSILGNNNTALNLVAGSNITITPEKSNDVYTGKVTITSVNTTYDLLINGSLAFTPAETAITNDDLNSNHLKKTVSIVRGSWNYAGNGYTAASDWGNIDLAGTTIIKVGGSTSGYTQLFITPNTASTTSALKGEILYYIDNGDNYSPTWYRVLTNANYGSYLGYIGTTAVLKSSAALALTGITSATLSSTLTLTGTTSDKARINFSRGSDHDYPYNYITAPTGGIISIEPGGLSCSSTTGYLFTSSAFLPAVTNTYNLGTSTLKWNNIYATTFTGALSGNAASSTYTTYIRVTETEPTSGTYYYPIWTTGMSDGSNYIPRANDGFRYYSLEGTTSTKGTGLLFLGNSTAEGTAGNKEGRLGIYGPKSYYAYLYGPDTATGTFYFPNTGGTLVTHATRGTAVGSTTTPVYIAASGRATAGSTYAGGTKVTLNGTEKGATTASFYAPTAVGTSGYILKSNGSGAPTWIALSSITAGSATYTYRLAESSVSNVNTPNWKSGGISVDLFNKDASNKPYTGNNANGVINFSFGNHGTSGYYGFLLAHGNSSDRLYFRLATGTSSSTSNFTDWKTIAYTSDIPTVTNYYWANVKISASSSTSTSPTFATATMTRGVVGGYNNTTYALSTASFICNSWVRTVGSTGWYNETHGGGWYMIDGSWLRNYGSKPLYISVATYPSIVCNAQGGSEANIRFEIAGANKGYTGYKTSYGTFLWNSTALKYVYLGDNGYFYTQSYINVGAGNEKNASNPPYVWGVNGSDNFMRTYATSSLSVNYATSAGNADTLDGLHANAFLTRQRMTNPSSGTSYHGAVPYAIALKAAGTPLYADPEFASGNNSVAVYNNSGNGVVTITRVADSSAANSSGYVLKIVNSGGTSTPGRGGFYLSMSSRQNAVFAQIFRAKIPTGYSVVNAENTMGTGYKTFWLTDTAGTGKWEWYIRITICGSGGTYSSGGHVYLDGSGAVTWYLAYANVIDLTKGQYDGLNSIRWCGYLLSVVSALPSSPNSNTIYFVT